MAKIVYHAKEKSVFLSHAETVLLLAAELGTDLLNAFFPAKYPETWLTRRLLGLDSFSRRDFHVAKHRLIRRGLVAKRGPNYVITLNGQGALRKLRGLLSERTPRWDGKWRVVVFDIPETRKNYRDGLRQELKEAGYQRLQDSVWISKYPLPEDVLDFIETCDLGKYVYIFLSSDVDRKETLAAFFQKAEQPH